MFITLVGTPPDRALQLALFLLTGTTLLSPLYYRKNIIESFAAIPNWRPQTAFEGANGVTTFLIVATFTTR